MFIGFCRLCDPCHTYSALLSSCQSGRKQGSERNQHGCVPVERDVKKKKTAHKEDLAHTLSLSRAGPYSRTFVTTLISSRFSARAVLFLHRALQQSPQGKKPEEVSSGTHGRGDSKEAGIYYVPGTTASLPHVVTHTHEDPLRQALIIPK